MCDQWRGKKWYAYGTSMTDNSSTTGVFSGYLAQYAGLEEHNFGKGGSGIVPAVHDEDNVKTRIMRLSDNKQEADLITVELVPNDNTKATLGQITDLGDDTFCGNLHQVLEYLQVNTRAVIVVLIASRAIYDVPTSDYVQKRVLWEEAVEKICRMHGIPCWNGAAEAGLGYYRMKADDSLMADTIHLAKPGGEVLAKYYWGKLKNIYPTK